mgnify:CR=1 FL=1
MKVVLWEYIIWRSPAGMLQKGILDKLNELGGNGWEVVGIKEGSIRKGDMLQKFNIFILKRPSGQTDFRELH